MANPLILMVSVAGAQSREDIGLYLAALRDVGIRQVLVYPRSGCEIAYLSDRWFALIEDFLFHSKRLGMRIWLYDDFNWPSGDAAGQVTKHPEYCLRSLIVTGPEQGRIVSSGSGDPLYFGEKAFTDLMSAEAVSYFMECTHEQYYKRFHEHFGSTIAGIFTDEPAVGYTCGSDGIPYYEGLAEDYQAACGRDLFADIEAQHPELTQDAMAVIGRRFKSNYIDRLALWCSDRNILLTGHLMNDSMPLRSVRASGDLLKCLSGFMLPGVDEIDTALAGRWLCPLLGVAAYAAGSDGAMAELFALGPCELPYATKLCMLFLAAAFRIDHYFLAISHMDFRGNLKISDFFNHFGVDQPDFAGMKQFGQLAAKAAQYAQKDYKADVYIRYPTRVCAKNLLTGISDAPLAQLTAALTYRQIQWKFIADGDAPKDAPIIEFDGQFRYLLQDTVTDDAALIASMLPFDPLICTPTGDLPEGIFVRKYTDGDYLILNLAENGGIYFVAGEARYLEKHGVITGSEKPGALVGTPVPVAAFRVSYDRPNITRVVCDETGEGTIFCDTPTSLTFAIRRGECIQLNGETIVGTQTTSLSFGFRELYADTATVTLQAGCNRIRLQNDVCYLPAAFLMGDFEARYDTHTVRLSQRSSLLSPGQRIEGYGVATLAQEIFIPESANAIRLSGTKLYTRVYAGDILLGEAIAPPYVFDIRSFRGQTVLLRLQQHSSMAPMFGDSDQFPRKGNMYKKRIPDSALLFGLDGLDFI